MTKDLPQKAFEAPASPFNPEIKPVDDPGISVDELALLIEDPFAIEPQGDCVSPLDSDAAYPALPEGSSIRARVLRTPSTRKSPQGMSFRGRMALAVLGGVVLQAMMPGALLFMYAAGSLPPGESAQVVGQALSLLGETVGLSLLHGVPMGMIFTVLLMAKMRDFARVYVEDEGPLMYAGLLMGALLGCMNLPMLAMATYIELSSTTILRMAIMMLVTGASMGAWVGYQAYAESYTRSSWWPRFSLRTLVMLVVGWGVLVSVFLPL